MNKAEIKEAYEKDKIFFVRFLQYFLLPFALPARLLLRNNFGKKYYYGLFGLLASFTLFYQIHERSTSMLGKNISEVIEAPFDYLAHIITTSLGEERTREFLSAMNVNDTWLFNADNKHMHDFILSTYLQFTFIVLIIIFLLFKLIIFFIRVIQKRKKPYEKHYGKSWLCYLPFLKRHEKIIHIVIEPAFLLFLAYVLYEGYKENLDAIVSENMDGNLLLAIKGLDNTGLSLARILLPIGIATLILSMTEHVIKHWQHKGIVESLTLKTHSILLWPFLFIFLLYYIDILPALLEIIYMFYAQYVPTAMAYIYISIIEFF